MMVLQWCIAFKDRLLPRYSDYGMNIYAANFECGVDFSNTLLAHEDTRIHRWYGTILPVERSSGNRITEGDNYET